MHSLDAFTNPCNSSVQTVKRVERCPSSGASYKKAAKEKNCSSLAGKALECQSFEYHCVLSDDRKYAIEVCAPSIKIIGTKILFIPYTNSLNFCNQLCQT